MDNTWDLTPLYRDAAAWRHDFDRLPAAAETFAAHRGHLADSPAALAAAFADADEFSRLAEKLYCYAHLLSDENTADNTNRSRLDELTGLLARLSPLESWFEPEVMAIDDETMRTFLTSPELDFYRRSLEELLRAKNHILSEPEERLFGQLSDVLGAPEKTFSILNDADLDFGKIRDEHGKLKQLTHGNYRNFMDSSDRDTRRRAFKKLYSGYRGLRNTFAATLDATVRHHVVEAKIRRYPSALAQALEPDNVPETVYRSLIEAVRSNLDGFADYLELRREVLGIEKLDMYDLYTPLIPDFRREYEFDEAVELVKGALKPLGELYSERLGAAFIQRWIDVPERKGKRSGAYSGGCYDSYPYILLNYNRTLNDVFTLAHELGHSLHSAFSNAAQPYHYADYRIFVAEVASTTNEILLFEHLLKQSSDPDFRAALRVHLADEIRGTIFRQTMFAEFELMIHELAASGEALSADLLSREYYRLNDIYHGGKIAADRDIELEWARIPHFYYNFYVYKYATGMSAALRLAGNILSGNPGMLDRYLGFLSAGDSKDVIDILRDAGVDLTRPEPVAEALAFFNTTVSELRRELGK